MEIWKNVKDYEGIYQVSNYGRVKSIEIEYIHNLWKKPVIRKEKILKETVVLLSPTRKYKRSQIVLYKDKKSKTFSVAYLVISSFLGVSHDKEINHKDGNPQNNNLNNLEWVSHKENMEHAAKNNLMTRTIKEIEITKNDTVLRFESGIKAAEYIGCKPQRITQIANQKSSEKTIFGWSARYIEKENE